MADPRPPGRALLVTLGLSIAAITISSALGGTPAAATGSIALAGTPQAVPDSYVVVLADHAARTGVAPSAQRLAQRYGGTVTSTYQSALRGFAVRMSEARAARLAADPAVSSVQQSQLHILSDTQPNPPSWGLDRVDQRDLPLSNSYTYATTAGNVNAYIIDTGIRTTHQTFGGRARHGRDTVDNDNDATDCQGHGTHVAGTVGGSQYGVAKGVTLWAVRVLDCAGRGTTEQVVGGIDWVTANAVKPAVANMSLGGGADSALDTAVTNSINAGITYAIAAGNGDIFGNPQNACNFSPARVGAAITVGATQNNDARASFSNYGTCLDIFAPGVNITSAWLTNDTATNTISGTSMATPHVAGAAALILAGNPTWSPQQVRDAMVNAATLNKVTNPLTGSPDRLLFTTEGGSDPGPGPGPGCGTKTNGTNVSIPDLGTAQSQVGVTGCDGTGSATATVEVHIVHTYRGDLVIDLVAPDGTAYRLKNANLFDGAPNVNASYPVNLSAEVRNGTWTLRVRDAYSFDTGYIDSWSLTA